MAPGIFFGAKEKLIDKDNATVYKFLALLLMVGCATDMDTLEVGKETNSILPGTRPNIVVIMTDDLDYKSMQRMIDLGLVPNIDNLVRKPGVKFQSYFISNSLCCPSRATALTGQYSHNNGVHTTQADDIDGGVDALDDSSTLATWLQSVGYRTGHIGKYLNGYGTEKDQTTPSFQDTYVPPGWSRWMATIGNGTYKMFKFSLHDTTDSFLPQIESYGAAGEETAANYQTTILQQKAVSFITEAAALGDPFYLEIMPVAPHAEALPENGKFDYFIRHDPQDEIDKPTQLALIDTLALPADPSFDYVNSNQPGFVRNKPALTAADKQNLLEFYRARLKSMLAVDDLVGSVMSELDARGLLNNTVVIFTSDNGFLFGEHRLGGKGVAFDEASKVPLYIRVPSRPFASTPKLVTNADLAPTIAELAGAPAGLIMDGRSLMPFLSAQVPMPPDWRHRILLEHWGTGAGGAPPSFEGVRAGKWLYVDYEGKDPELYDLDLDPWQTNNVWQVASYASTLSSLAGYTDQLKTCSGDDCRSIEME